MQTITKKWQAVGLIFNRLFLNIHTNRFGTLSQLLYTFKHLLNLADKSWFRKPILKTGQISRCPRVQNLRKIDDYAQAPIWFAFLDFL